MITNLRMDYFQALVRKTSLILPLLQTVTMMLGLAVLLVLSAPAQAAPAPAPTVADPVLTALLLGKLALLKGYVLENGVFENLLGSAATSSSRRVLPKRH